MFLCHRDVIVTCVFAVEDVRSQLEGSTFLSRLIDLDAPSYFFKFTHFDSIPESVFAEQLTYVDAVSDDVTKQTGNPCLFGLMLIT